MASREVMVRILDLPEVKKTIADLTYRAETAEAERDSARNAIDRVRDQHRPHRIYDECDHRHEYTDPDHGLPDGVIHIAEIGLTCEDGYMFSVCKECCTDDDGAFTTEECVDTHGHKPDEAHHCRTMAALDGETP